MISFSFLILFDPCNGPLRLVLLVLFHSWINRAFVLCSRPQSWYGTEPGFTPSPGVRPSVESPGASSGQVWSQFDQANSD